MHFLHATAAAEIWLASMSEIVFAARQLARALLLYDDRSAKFVEIAIVKREGKSSRVFLNCLINLAEKISSFWKQPKITSIA